MNRTRDTAPPKQASRHPAKDNGTPRYPSQASRAGNLASQRNHATEAFGARDPVPVSDNNQAQGLLRQGLVRSEVGMSNPGDAAERDAESLADGVFGGRRTVVTDAQGATAKGLPQDAGHALPADLKAGADEHLNADFSSVRVHDSAVARSAANQLGARALTLGSHVWLGEGASERDAALMSHELAHVKQQTESGARSAMRQDIASALPPSVSTQSASLEFDLPARKQLTEELATNNATHVSLGVTPGGLQLTFTPALIIQAPFYASDMEWSSLTYDFASASVTGIGLRDTSVLPSGQDQARALLTAKVVALFAGTRIAAPHYDPLTDADLMGTLNGIRANIQAMPSSGADAGGFAAQDVNNISGTVEIGVDPPLHQGTPEGAVDISGRVRMTARLQGTGAAVQAVGPVIESITISGDSILVQKDGESVAQIHDLTINPGGSVRIGRMTLLGAARTAAGTESAAKLLGLMLLLGQGTSDDRLAVAGAEPDLNAQIVPGLTRSIIQEALTQAIRDLISRYARVFPGYDLHTIFSVPILGDFPTRLPGENPNSRMG